MTNLDIAANEMSRTTNPAPHEPTRRKGPAFSAGTGGVCPFCGMVKQVAEDPCPRCTLEDTPATREATRQRVGPWYVLQTRNPSAPGMNFATLIALVKKGQVTVRSVVRGPTTHQLWCYAGQIKGLSRELGVCYACGQALDRSANLCPHCHKLQEAPVNPDAFLENPPAAPPTAAAPAPPAAAPAVAEETPLTRRPTARPSGQEILTPKELAAAFSLAMPTNRGTDASSGTLDVDADDEVAERSPRPRRRLALPVGAVLAVAMTAGAFWLLFDVESRTRVQEWTRDQYGTVRTHIDEAWATVQKNAASPAKTKTSPADPQQQQQPVAPAPRPQAVGLPTELQPIKPPVRHENPARPEAAQRREDRPAAAVVEPPAPRDAATDVRPDPRPLVTRTPEPRSIRPADALVARDPAPNAGAVPPAATPKLLPRQEPQDLPQRTVVQQALPKEEKPAPAAPVADAEAANVDKARKLYWAAIDAEGAGDYKGAVAKYEEIRAMPAEAWPSDLQMRLKFARGQADKAK
jgi:hypothetical protein